MKAKRKLPAKASNPEPGEKQEQVENEDDGIQVRKKVRTNTVSGPVVLRWLVVITEAQAWAVPPSGLLLTKGIGFLGGIFSLVSYSISLNLLIGPAKID